jgi:hypothetical protein
MDMKPIGAGFGGGDYSAPKIEKKSADTNPVIADKVELGQSEHKTKGSDLHEWAGLVKKPAKDLTDLFIDAIKHGVMSGVVGAAAGAAGGAAIGGPLGAVVGMALGGAVAGFAGFGISLKVNG